MTPFECAQKEWGIGVKEVSGKKHNPCIVWYASFTTLKATDDETPWCSSFMCAMAFLGGQPSTKSAAAKSWLNYGLPGDGSKGDIAIFKRSGGHHVAFVNKPFKTGDKVINVLGGNQGNAVSIMDYDAKNILGFRRFAV